MTLWSTADKRQPTQAQRLFHRLVREWLWIGLLLLPITAYLSLSPGLALNNPLYDSLRRLTPLPVDSRILLVTIDEDSLKQLGPWPWPPNVHADLIGRLSAAQPAGILFDAIFSDPAAPANDKRLAEVVRAAQTDLPHVSYASVLRGEVPAEQLRNRLILVGATASGMGDRFVTPLSSTPGTTEGVEIQTNVLDSLLQGHSTVDLPGWLAALMATSLVALLLGLLLYRPRYALWMTLGCMAAAVLGAWALLRLGHWWSPAASLIGLLLSYLIWNWRRLSVIIAYFGWELARLDNEPKVLPERRRAPASQGDVLQARIFALEQAVSRTRDTRRFMADGLECLPVATLITDPKGNILLANRVAREVFGNDLVAENLLEQLADLGYPPLHNGVRVALSELVLVEFRDIHQRSLRMELAPLLPAEGDTALGWLLSLTDLSKEREAQQHRETMLRFLSHDLRAPHSAILALLDLHESESPVFGQIEQQVRRALSLTESFVQLAKAEADGYHFQPTLFAMLVMDAFDQVAVIAQLKGIHLVHDLDEADEGMVSADQSLLTRALFNVLENAIKYSSSGTTVRLRHSTVEGWLECRISDQGPGIAAADLPELFSQYRRFESAQGSEGLGLGLSMVKAVVERHKGHIGCESVVGKGTTFTLQLPLLEDPFGN
jgi:CHASE2 domain-containing sensor protein/signal transduction histidine kinase